MPQLTITYDGRTIYDADVQTFGYETNAKGELFVSAGTKDDRSVDDQILGQISGDDRYTADELALMRKRQQSEPMVDGPAFASFDNG